jgi:hypothetical protein
LFCGKAREEDPSKKTKTWVDNIKTNLGEMEWGDVDWLGTGTNGQLL